MGLFSLFSQVAKNNAADKPESQNDALFDDFDETVAKLQQFDLEASDDKGNVNSSSPAPQSRIKK